MLTTRREHLLIRLIMHSYHLSPFSIKMEHVYEWHATPNAVMYTLRTVHHLPQSESWTGRQECIALQGYRILS